ncbi:MAG: transcriptional regulator NrdR [Pirellulaceae bacterium]|nr:transcriptional regulator NrdR [Pirellulaceae bacterium]
MKCPYCHGDNDRVIDSRASLEGFSIRRRRQCTVCKRRYTTYERIEELSTKVVKKDGVREPLQREKLRSGIAKACWKRPVSDLQIDDVVNEVLDQVASEFDQEVPSREIGECVMEGLAKLDQVAYVRFASVYREFKDVRDFVEELQPMLDAAEHKDAKKSS